uniref:Uncharacterized protein n=1 Tax=Paramormyrops kingsleyae TaxID=1676925 RepID=A0A3B3QG38_9TELE
CFRKPGPVFPPLFSYFKILIGAKQFGLFNIKDLGDSLARVIYFRCFSSLSPALEPGPSPEVCRLVLLLLFKNILSRPLRASVR